MLIWLRLFKEKIQYLVKIILEDIKNNSKYKSNETLKDFQST